ncbi:MAG: hypothetical protein J4G05_12085 [Chlorobi bacterium]|nr:hypothetical protein [Chlorobiota bacterium]
MSDTQHHIKTVVPVYFMEEEAQWVAYCPLLELSTYADSLGEAKVAFSEVLEIFLEEMVKRNSLEKELIRLGWTLAKSSYLPPAGNRTESLLQLGNHKKEDLPILFPSVYGGGYSNQVAVE